MGWDVMVQSKGVASYLSIITICITIPLSLLQRKADGQYGINWVPDKVTGNHYHSAGVGTIVYDEKVA